MSVQRQRFPAVETVAKKKCPPLGFDWMTPTSEVPPSRGGPAQLNAVAWLRGLRGKFKPRTGRKASAAAKAKKKRKTKLTTEPSQKTRHGSALQAALSPSGTTSGVSVCEKGHREPAAHAFGDVLNGRRGPGESPRDSKGGPAGVKGVRGPLHTRTTAEPWAERSA